MIIDQDGYIKLTDFGLAKEDIDSVNKATSFCGTQEYLAPEILERVPYGKEVDWWSLGVILYEMLAGRPPFYNNNRDRLFKSILNVHLTYPDDISLSAKSLLKKIFVRKNRLGCNGADEVKQHPFFKEINWDAVIAKKIKPPFIPNIKSCSDTKYIDVNFLEEPPIDSYNKGDTVESKDDQFKDFSAACDFDIFDMQDKAIVFKNCEKKINIHQQSRKIILNE